MQSDRFARKIVPFLKSPRGALAAADAQSVGPVHQRCTNFSI
jgi:hypothetical protein